MSTNADRVEVLVDTSVAVPLVVAGHEHHESVAAAVGGPWATRRWIASAASVGASSEVSTSRF